MQNLEKEEFLSLNRAFWQKTTKSEGKLTVGCSKYVSTIVCKLGKQDKKRDFDIMSSHHDASIFFLFINNCIFAHLPWNSLFCFFKARKGRKKVLAKAQTMTVLSESEVSPSSRAEQWPGCDFLHYEASISPASVTVVREDFPTAAYVGEKSLLWMKESFYFLTISWTLQTNIREIFVFQLIQRASSPLYLIVCSFKKKLLLF